MKRPVSGKSLLFGSLTVVLSFVLWMTVGQPENEPFKRSVDRQAGYAPSSAQRVSPRPNRPLQTPPSKLVNPQTAVARAAVSRVNAPTRKQIQQTSNQILAGFNALFSMGVTAGSVSVTGSTVLPRPLGYCSVVMTGRSSTPKASRSTSCRDKWL